MNTSTVNVLTVAFILVTAWFLQRREWKKKPLTDFTRHLESRNWRAYEMSIRELKKRGQDVSIYIPQVVSLLVADSKFQRATGQRVIEKCYPELVGELNGYKFVKDISICREKAAVLLAKFPESHSRPAPLT